MEEFTPPDDCDGASNISSVSTAVNGNATVMLNGTVFSLSSLSGDGVIKDDYGGDIRLDSTTNTPAALVSENGSLIVDTRGLVLSVSDSVAGTYGIPLSVIAGAGDLQGSGHLLASGDADGQTQHIFQITSTAPPVDQRLTTADPAVSSATGDENKAKRRGGWPKGKKRKPEKSGIKAPKAPATGYVLFAVGRRSELRELHPELSFAEITKLLGHEWSTLPGRQKKHFLDQAEADKQRYANQLRLYQSTEAYQSYMRKKKLKVLCDGDPTSIGGTDVDNTIYTDLDDDEMYCKLCDQYFSSLHNKKEHIYGRQHLQNLTGVFEKELTKDMLENPSNNSNLAGGSLVSSDLMTTSNDQTLMGNYSYKPSTTDPDIETFVHSFLERNYDRDLEINELQQALLKSRENNTQLLNKMTLLKEMETKLEQDVANLKAYNAALVTQIDTLRMVPTLFGVINF